MTCSKVKQEMLNYDSILTAIAPENLKLLTRLDIFESINSTNTYLLEAARAGLQPGACCFAEQQTSGQGRNGKNWFSPAGGNLYFSVLWEFAVDQVDLAPLSLAIGVMVVNALKRYGIANGLQLKWPNDVLYEGRKLSGILLQSLPAKNNRMPVVIGIGLNVFFENKPAQDWIDVAEITHRPPLRNYLAALLLNELFTELLVYQQYGFAKFVEQWRALDGLAGAAVAITNGHDEISGLAQGITDQGELLLQTDTQGLLRRGCGTVSLHRRR